MQLKKVFTRLSVRHLLLLTIAVLALSDDAYGFCMLNAQIQLRATIVSVMNIAVFVTALISIKQYFWPGDNNTMPFHILNIVFVILFYVVSLPFLISNREYYEAYAELTPASVLGKFFMSINISSFAQWVIISSVIINVLYIRKFRTDYYQAGIAKEEEQAKESDYPGEPSAPEEDIHQDKPND